MYEKEIDDLCLIHTYIWNYRYVRFVRVGINVVYLRLESCLLYPPAFWQPTCLPQELVGKKR